MPTSALEYRYQLRGFFYTLKFQCNMEEIKSFLITQCGDPEKNSFEPPTDFDGLVELLIEFRKESAWHFDKDAMSEMIYGITVESQAKQRQDEWIAHQKAQNRFNAANSALNGLLADGDFRVGLTNLLQSGLGRDPLDSEMAPLYASLAVKHADALIAELNKDNQ